MIGGFSRRGYPFYPLMRCGTFRRHLSRIEWRGEARRGEATQDDEEAAEQARTDVDGTKRRGEGGARLRSSKKDCSSSATVKLLHTPGCLQGSRQPLLVVLLVSISQRDQNTIKQKTTFRRQDYSAKSIGYKFPPPAPEPQQCRGA